MTDYHTHVLPQIDDGSSSVEMSLAMLRELKKQGADTVICTPHFYAQRSSIKRFLTRRHEAREKLSPYLTEEMPELRLGAEVFYFDGMSRAEGIEALCVEGSSLMLVEMPFCTWSSRMLDEVMSLNELENVQVMLAHINRYLKLQKKPMELIERLSSSGIAIQINAEFLTDLRTRGKALKLLRLGLVDALGSDCHDMQKRAPNLARALEIMAKAGFPADERLNDYV